MLWNGMAKANRRTRTGQVVKPILRAPAVYNRKPLGEETMGARLAGKTALVTAAAQGIGRASALAMAREGAQVIATDVDERALSSLAGIENVRTQKLDVLDDAAIAKLFGDLPALDVLFNCAGYVHVGTILDCAPKDWEFTFNLNVRAMYMMIRAALPKMLARFERDGIGASIVNMSSICGALKGLTDRLAYGASKAAVVGLTKGIAADYVKKGIRCNAVAPGTVESPSLRERIDAFPDPDEARKMFIARQPMGRMATPEEIAPVVVFLASDESAFVTGNIYSCDGGWSI
jgi:2-keto-3-deoxy-L-fuconate dehydrogenase